VPKALNGHWSEHPAYRVTRNHVKELTIMKITTIFGSNVYVRIKTPDRSIDVLIQPGSVAYRLQEHATELREEAASLLRDADFVEQAANILEHNAR
jgi:hypothetical protein